MASHDQIAQINFPVRASVLTGALVIALTVGYYFFSSSVKDTIVFFAAAIAAAGAVLAAFYAAKGLSLSAAMVATATGAAEREVQFKKRQHALRFAERWNDPGMFHVRDVIRSLFELQHDAPEFLEQINAKKTNVFHFLNFLEELALAIEIGDADEPLSRDAFRGVVLNAWSKLQNWVNHERVTRHRPRIWCKLEELARRWNV